MDQDNFENIMMDFNGRPQEPQSLSGSGDSLSSYPSPNQPGSPVAIVTSTEDIQVSSASDERVQKSKPYNKRVRDNNPTKDWMLSIDWFIVGI